jgi:hypothetical protein
MEDLSTAVRLRVVCVKVSAPFGHHFSNLIHVFIRVPLAHMGTTFHASGD